jgi:hypothetical protein
VTLILSVNGPETVWMVADRRVTYRVGFPKDDARKLMLLETTDGQAILGYAGLGETMQGTEPADWMSAVLRGRSGTLEQSLRTLAAAMNRQLPRHLHRLNPHQSVEHNLVATAFVGNTAHAYSTSIALTADRTRQYFRHTRHVKSIPGKPLEACPPTRLTLAGSGAHYLTRDQRWERPLLRLVNAHARGRIGAETVADHLAGVNHAVHLGLNDGSVGPRCIVVWRHRKQAAPNIGGKHQCYNGTTPERDTESLPTISSGRDLHAFQAAIWPYMMRLLDGVQHGGPNMPLDLDEETKTKIEQLPDTPDEDLR